MLGWRQLRIASCRQVVLTYSLADRYFGIEPEEWLVQKGIERELGGKIVNRKRPRFLYNANFCAPRLASRLIS
jgi:hypothetical protein